jgi:hypothetical protein
MRKSNIECTPDEFEARKRLNRAMVDVNHIISNLLDVPELSLAVDVAVDDVIAGLEGVKYDIRTALGAVG